MSELKNAKGMKGILLFSEGTSFSPVFRVHDEDKNFIDYNISHYDMHIEIQDDDVVIVGDGSDGHNPCLDYDFLNDKPKKDKKPKVDKFVDSISQDDEKRIKDLNIDSSRKLQNLYVYQINRINMITHGSLSYLMKDKIWEETDKTCDTLLAEIHENMNQIKKIIEDS